MTESVMLMGAPGSPYTRKMLALLRYRRIPYRFIIGSYRNNLDLPKPKVQLLPTFYFPGADGTLEAAVDSTPIIRRLEPMAPDRSVIPDHPVIAFLDYLIEDYADEWLTKAMFHYRWHFADDIEKAGDILPRWSTRPLPETRMQEMKKFIQDRQISRLYVVGSNEVTAPVIEASYERFLLAMSAHLEQCGFLFGARPSAADFGIYGQLTQLVEFDPTPMRIAYTTAPRVCAWVQMMEDQSGLEPLAEDWLTPEALPQTLTGLLKEIGRVYVPAMLANAEAVRQTKPKVETEIDGKTWVQEPFPYQAKCVEWIGQAYRNLSEPDRRTVDGILDGTGCAPLFEPH